MNVVTIEGVEYVLKSDVQTIITDRVKNISTKASQHEEHAQKLQSQLDELQGKLGTVDVMSEKMKELEAQLNEANSRYDRHVSMADMGITDPDVRDLVEWQYSKSTKGTENPQSMVDWLKGLQADPTNAPVTIRHHLQLQTASTEQVQDTAAPQQQISTPPQPTAQPPKTNTGAQPAPSDTGDIYTRAVQDPVWYKENRHLFIK